MRRNRFAFALPLVLPLLAGAFARADDAPRPAPATPPAGADAPAKPAPDAPKIDAPKTDAPKADPRAGDAAKSGIAWIHDYDEAKTKAAEQKKGLFVYLTPSWFT